ncbi:MAG: GtrA family protein [Halieaceae bacterium]|nr:GtrA family protein [Halieaceae bacterium]
MTNATASVVLSNQLVRFFLVGGVNTIFGYSSFALFIWLGLHYALAVLLATVLGVVFNFSTIGKLVFKRFSPWLIHRFVAVYAVLYVINVAGIKALLIADLNSYLAGGIMVVPMGLLGFGLLKKLVFKPAGPEPSGAGPQ